MRFKMVNFNIKTQNLELVNLKSVNYAQPIPLSLMRIAWRQFVTNLKRGHNLYSFRIVVEEVVHVHVYFMCLKAGS